MSLYPNLIACSQQYHLSHNSREHADHAGNNPGVLDPGDQRVEQEDTTRTFLHYYFLDQEIELTT